MKNLLSNLTGKLGKTGLFFKKHSPEICLVAGSGLLVFGTVKTTIGALKSKDVIKQANKGAKDIEDAKKLVEDGKVDASEYTEEDVKQDKIKIVVNTSLQVIRNVAPGLIIGGIGAGLLIKGHSILNARNTALTGAYMALEKAYDDYRNRVIEDQGEEKDFEYRFGTKKEELIVTEKDEDGKEKTVKVDNYEMASNPPSYLSRIFDETSYYWSDSPVYNKSFVISVQSRANEELKHNGYLFLNDVYDMLGFERVPEGQLIGWMKDNPKGDGYIDFGLYDVTDDDDTEQKRAFINGTERSILLDFNVDPGTIYEYI